MRRLALLLCGLLALFCMGAASDLRPVLPPSAQPGFQRVMHAVNQEHRLGAGARVTDISIQPRRVRLQLALDGHHRTLTLVHRRARDSTLHSRYFSFTYDADEWRGQRDELERLAGIVDESFTRTPWVVPGNDLDKKLPRWMVEPIELGRGLALALVLSSWALGLLGAGLLLFRRPQ